MYLNNRYHDPALGSFLSVDPLVTTTGEPYVYGSANPTTLSDPDGLMPCAARSCPDGIPVVHYDRHDMRSWVWPALPTDDAAADSGYSKRKAAHDYWTPVDGPAGRLGSGGLMLVNAFPFPPASDDGRNCDWRCGVATTLTGVVGYPLASMLCGKGTIVSGGFGSAAICTGAFTGATGLVNVVYESTSNPKAGRGRLACAFAFGTSSPGFNVISSAAGSAAGAGARGATKATEYASEIGLGWAVDTGIGVLGDGLCE